MSKKRKKLTEAEQDIYSALLLESDRGCVLAAHGFLDTELERLLREHFWHKSGGTDKELDWLLSGSNAPIKSFYVRTMMARAIGLIDGKSFDSLVNLNDLRNHFAHYPGRVALTEARVRTIYDPLHQILKGYVQYVERSAARRKLRFSAAHIKFIGTAMALHVAIDAATDIAARHDATRGINFDGLEIEKILNQDETDSK